jgi:hypothetical protein
VAGCRGKDSGIPAGVTDLKAAIRYIRYNEEILPGSTDRIVVYGHSGGGSQSAVLGSSGDSSLYTPYLKEIGAADLESTDAPGNSIEYRLNMFSPLYYLMEANSGYQAADAAPDWRIRTGIEQSDTPVTTEINLALALESYGSDVDFETVWGQGHTQAERTGDSTENFIDWVNSLWN